MSSVDPSPAVDSSPTIEATVPTSKIEVTSVHTTCLHNRDKLGHGFQLFRTAQQDPVPYGMTGLRCIFHPGLPSAVRATR